MWKAAKKAKAYGGIENNVEMGMAWHEENKQA